MYTNQYELHLFLYRITKPELYNINLHMVLFWYYFLDNSFIF